MSIRSDDFELAQAMFGSPTSSNQNGSDIDSGTAVSDSIDGVVNVSPMGSTLGSNQILTLPTWVSVKTGDTVSIKVINGSPVVIGAIGSGDRVLATAKDAATISITSTHGLVFKDNEISTTLVVTVYQPGGNKIDDLAGLIAAFGISAHIEWKWQRKNDDAWHTIVSTDSRLSNDGFSFAISPSDVDTRTSFEAFVITDD